MSVTPDGEAGIVRCILDSMAVAIRDAARPVVAGPTEAASWGNVLVDSYQPDEQEEAWERADEIVLASRDYGPGLP